METGADGDRSRWRQEQMETEVNGNTKIRVFL